MVSGCGVLAGMTALLLALALTAVPEGEDLPLPAPMTGMASSRLALPVSIAFDLTSITDDVTPLVKDDGTRRAGGTRDVVWSLARYAPAVARRHFEEASWNDGTNSRTVTIKSVAVLWRQGPSYEVKVELERRDGEKRLGVATGTGFGTAPRNNAQRMGAAYANAFGARPKNGLTEANPTTDAETIRAATLQAFDSALLQLSAVWGGEQMMEKARQDAEAAMKRAQEAQKPAAKKKK